MPWRLELQFKASIGFPPTVYFLTAVLWPPHDKLGPRPIENYQFEAVKHLITVQIAMVVRKNGSGTRLHAMHWREPIACTRGPAWALGAFVQ